MNYCYKCEILADSICSITGNRLTTFEITYPRFIHSEFMTHRAFSRNAASSRAIPNNKLRAIVNKKGAYPVFWGKNQSGMQAQEELSGIRLYLVKKIWDGLKKINLFGTWILNKLGLHKQLANRPLEAWMPITIIVSGTEFENFFHLRCSPFAQPEIKEIATLMKHFYNRSSPTILKPGEWHLPLFQSNVDNLPIHDVKRISAGRCARISYLTHDGKRDTNEDIRLCNKLIKDGHWSPLEHQATPTGKDEFCGNFRGWKQFRKEFENENITKKKEDNK